MLKNSGFNFTKLQRKLLIKIIYIMSIIQNDHSEGPVAKAIEKQTAKLPSDIFLWAAVASMAASATLKCMSMDKSALFVGQRAAPFFLFGIYPFSLSLLCRTGKRYNSLINFNYGK